MDKYFYHQPESQVQPFSPFVTAPPTAADYPSGDPAALPYPAYPVLPQIAPVPYDHVPIVSQPTNNQVPDEKEPPKKTKEKKPICNFCKCCDCCDLDICGDFADGGFECCCDACMGCSC